MNASAATQAYVALGSNLGDSRQQVLTAMDAVAELPGTRVLARSNLYRTPPWGVLAQPPFVNAVIKIETSLGPHQLLDALLAIERASGRVRDGERWGPRMLDLDILHMDGIALVDDRLTLPHPRMAERAFVLLPLADVAPDLCLDGLGPVSRQLLAVDRAGCEVLE